MRARGAGKRKKRVKGNKSESGDEEGSETQREKHRGERGGREVRKDEKVRR